MHLKILNLYLFILIAASPCLVMGQKILTPCERAIMNFTQKSRILKKNPELQLVNGSKNFDEYISNSKTIVKYWSYEDTQRLIFYLKRRIGTTHTLERIQRISILNSTNFKEFKKRVRFFDRHIGREAVNEKLKISLIPFTTGDLQEMKKALSFLTTYLTEKGMEQDEVLQLVEKRMHVFSNIKVDQHQPILEILENYFETNEIITIITESFISFSSLKFHQFQAILDILENHLNLENTKEQFHPFQVIQAILDILENHLKQENTKEQITKLIKKHLPLFSVLDPDHLLPSLNFLKRKIGDTNTVQLIKTNFIVLPQIKPDLLAKQFTLAEKYFTTEEILDFIKKDPAGFFNINPEELNLILNAITKYAGQERTSDIIKTNFKQLIHTKWDEFNQMHVSEFLQTLLPSRINIANSQGTKGYIQFANKYFNGNMKKAWAYAKRTLNTPYFNQLGWTYFDSTTKQFFHIINSLFDSQNKIYNRYKGMAGYVNFANEYFNGTMTTTFLHVSSAVNKRIFKTLRWTHFVGSTKEFQSLRNTLFDDQGQLKTKYQKMKGLVELTEQLLTENHTKKPPAPNLDENKSESGNIKKTYSNVKAVLSEIEFEKLEWKYFPGTVEDFRNFSTRLLNEDGQIKPEYIGLDGQIEFSIQYFDGSLHKAYNQAKTLLNTALFKQLKWKLSLLSAVKLKKLKNILIHSNRVNLHGFDHYLMVADDYFDGNMRKTYEIVSAFMEKEKFQSLGWRKFQGTTFQYEQLPDIILDEYGKPRKKYMGVDGYIHFSEKHANGNMSTAYSNVSIVLGLKTLSDLGWKLFTGSTEQLKKVIKSLLNSKGLPRLEYHHLEGYKTFSDEYFKGNMERTFKLVSASSSNGIIEKLGWSIFKGTTAQLETLLQDFKENYPENYQGPAGLHRVADKIFSGNTSAAYKNVSTLRPYLFQSENPQKEFYQLQWKN